jgi:hypothetical protein
MERPYPAAPAILNAPLPVDVRARLEARRRHLDRMLAPSARAERAQMSAAIAGLLGAFGGNAGGSPEMVVSKYLHVLEDLPLWAVLAACRALERGEVDGVSLDFRPTAPRVRQVARELMAPWNEEVFRIREALTLPAMAPEDAEMRERIGKLMTEFAQGLKMGKFKRHDAAGEAA